MTSARRLRLPLYVKILFWFFLNLTLLAAGFTLLFNAQFNLDFDWLLATSAHLRIDATRDLIVAELNSSNPDEWPGLLERFNTAYHVRFALFDDEGNHLIGDVAPLPSEVRARIPGSPEGRLRRPPMDRNTPPGPSREEMRRRWHPPVRALVRTTEPTRYWLLVSARVDNPFAGEPLHVVLVSESTSLSSGGLIFDMTQWLKVGVAAILCSVLFWLPLVGGITRSIAQITDATRQIAEGKFDGRVSTRRRDELGTLGAAINQMAARLDGFVQGQKRFLGDIAHELCSPLARLQVALGILEERTDEQNKKYAISASEKAQQIAALVNELLSFSKASFGAAALHLQPVSVLDAAREAARRETQNPEEIDLNVTPDAMVLADSDLLIRALANLLRNSLRHAAGTGKIQVTATRDGANFRIAVADSGPGVSEAELPLIFDAFYRTDSSRTRETGGTGLGLTIVKTCIESCGGTASAHNRNPRGLEVILTLPAADFS
ncbi:MAG: hypothetical protein QOD99_2518 [Chthoniobacter sp.]|nr:hypothetical protein [Chthoniobacter sp.]